MSASVFPARAGMSPEGKHNDPQVQRVPRASGDEPIMSKLTTEDLRCSPRERG